MKLKTQVEVVLGVMIVALGIWTTVCGIIAFNEQVDWAQVPTMSVEQLVQGRDALIARIGKPTNAEDYFQILMTFANLHKSSEKQEAVGVGRYELQSHGIDTMTLQSWETEFVNTWQRAKLGNDIAAYSSAHRAEVDKYMIGMPTIPNAQWKADRFWKVFQFLFVLPLPLCVALYCFRIREAGGNIMLEVFNWRFVLASILWIYGLPYYRNMDIKHQVRRCQQVARFFLVSSIACFAGSKKPNDNKVKEQQGSDHPTWSVDINTFTWSKYVGTNDKVFHSQPVQQSVIRLTAPNGIYLGAFGSVPLSFSKDSGENYGFEHDLSLGWTGEVHKLVLNPDLTYINLEPLSHLSGDPLGLTLSISEDLKVGKNTVTPYFTINHYLPVRGNTSKSGTFNRFGVSYSFGFGKWSANSGAELMQDTGAFSNNPAWFAKASVGLSRKIGPLELSIPINAATPLTHVNDGRNTQIVLGFGLAYHLAHR